MTVLTAFCQLDINLDIRGRKNPNGGIASIVLACGHVNGTLSCGLMWEGPVLGRNMLFLAGEPGLYKKVGLSKLGSKPAGSVPLFQFLPRASALTSSVMECDLGHG